MRCKATKADGTPCQAPRELVDPESGYCPAHGPGGSERMREIARRGGDALREKYRASGFDPGELPSLQTHADARKALDLIYRGVCTGKITHKDATAATRTVEAWLKATAEEMTAQVVEELKAEVERLKAELKGPKLRRVR